MKKEMDFSQVDIQRLIELFKQYSVEELSLEDNGVKFDIKRDLPLELRPATTVIQSVSQPIAQSAALPSVTDQSSFVDQPAPEPTEESDGYEKVISPMVGTFYRAPSPDAEPYAREGDQVNPDKTVCLIEAMKMMNEIKADLSGKVIKFLVKNGEPVQPNQVLLLIKTE